MVKVIVSAETDVHIVRVSCAAQIAVVLKLIVFQLDNVSILGMAQRLTYFFGIGQLSLL